MAAVIKSKGGKMYRHNLDNDDENNIQIVSKKPKQEDVDDDETTDSDSESDISEIEDQSGTAMPINEWDDKPVLTAAGNINK